MTLRLKKVRCAKCGINERAYRAYCRKCKLANEQGYRNLRRLLNPETLKRRMFIYNKRYKHNITIEDYFEMFDAQEGKCAICNVIPLLSKNLHIDHDHKTDKIRALLCSKCNKGLGMFNDDPIILQKAINYLVHHGV